MKDMKTKYIIPGILLSMLCCLPGCNSWLDVKPDDKISEEEVFSSVEGFRSALNTAYIEMNASNLYGKSLGSELIEVMAGRYNISSKWTSMYTIYSDHNYKGTYALGRFEGIWSSGYNLISNINLLLKNCDSRKEVLMGDNYKIIKGEALALRAYLHFDLFRLFGPVYSTDSTKASLPYNKEFSYMAQELLPGNEFIGCVMSDLREAEKLLEADPIITQGPYWSEDLNDQNRDRVTRMNYYAVQALIARVSLYALHKAEALEAAKKVIEVQANYFPFTPATQVAGSGDNPDRILSSELLFALENPQRNTIFNSLFNVDNVKQENLLIPRDNIVKYVFEEQTDKDYRFNASFSQEKTISGTSHRVFRKYADVADTKLKYNSLLPMLRVSEMYYIAAECVADPKEGLDYLNQVLNKRGLESITNTKKLREQLTFEYMRELWGEGQLFFYYKRLYTKYILDGGSDYEGDLNMDKNAYVIPLPDSEIQYRETTEN